MIGIHRFWNLGVLSFRWKHMVVQFGLHHHLHLVLDFGLFCQAHQACFDLGDLFGISSLVDCYRFGSPSSPLESLLQTLSPSIGMVGLLTTFGDCSDVPSGPRDLGQAQGFVYAG